MKYAGYLKYDRKKVVGWSKGKPSLRSGEFAVRIAMTVPDALFDTDWPTATVDIPMRAVIAPVVTVADADIPGFPSTYTTPKE